MKKEVFKSKYKFFNPKEIVVGGHTFSLKNCKETIGHDDSLPYFAQLYIDNKKVASIHNDGWGGDTDIKEMYDADLYNKVENEVKDLSYSELDAPWDLGKSTIFDDLKIRNLMSIADTIAYNIISLQNLYRKKKTHVLAIRGGYELISWQINGVDKKVIDTFNLNLNIVAERMCDKLVAQGYTILSAPHIL